MSTPETFENRPAADACGDPGHVILEEALLESELRLRHLADNLPNAMVYQLTAEADGGRRFTYVSRGVERLNEVTVEEVMADGSILYRQLLPEYLPALLEMEARALEEFTTLSAEVQSRLPSGRVRWFAYASTPRRLPNGMIVWDGVQVDITDRKLVEEELERRVAERTDELKEACAQLRHAQKLESLGVLAGGIAHDFNNILQIILGNVQQTQRIVSELSPARPLLDNIEKAANRAAALTRQMLAYSGKGAFRIQTIDLGEAVSEISHLIRSSVSKKVTLRTHLETGLSPVQADPTQIQQIALNLIMNAAEALDPDQGGVVTVSVSQKRHEADSLRGNRTAESLPEGEYVCLAVSDTGCGMDAPTLERLFDPFFTTKFTGRGLGMSAVLGIARAHNAAILVESAPGEGTTVRALFPAAERPEVPESEPGEQPSLGAPAGPPTVLFVDDEPETRNLGVMMLEEYGFSVVTAADGINAVETLRERGACIDCAVIDLCMPKMDGVETLSELRRLRPDLPVVLASGYAERELAARLSGRRVEGIMEKPYQFAALAEMLAHLCGK